MKAACITATAPIRKEAAHRSEMTSQLLFAETVSVLETESYFTKVKCDYDGYEGWVQSSQLAEIDEDGLQMKGFTTQHGSSVVFKDFPMQLSLAAPVFAAPSDFIGKYPVTHSLRGEMFSFSEENIRRLSFSYLNTPYLWGGRSSFGIDCSGFCQQVFKMMNIRLDRDAYQQALQGEMVGFLQETICGDLAFFDNEEGRITHVGILLNAEEVIHASGCVRIDTIDSQGIINRDSGQRTHKLRTIRRFKP